MDVADRVVLVTGASAGIGRATALTLGRAGARLLVHGRDPRRTADVASLVGGTPLPADLAAPGAAEDLVRRAGLVHGRIDVIVLNAGIGLSAPLTDIAPAQVDELIQVDLAAPIRLTRAVLPGMVERGAGRLVLVTSVAGRTGVAGESVYAAAKAGLDAFSESVRMELAGTGVGVTCVVPGLVDTGFHRARVVRRIPRPVPPERVAQAIARAIADDRDEAWVPRWLRLAPIARAVTPSLFRRLSLRYGEPARIRHERPPSP